MIEKSINVAIVDDHTIFRETLKNYLSGKDNMNVNVVAIDVFDLLKKLKGSEVHVLVMDYFMTGLNGDDAIKLVKEEFPDVKILVLSMTTDMHVLSSLIDAGVNGILLKTDLPEELVRAIVSLSAHRIYRNRLFTEIMYWGRQNNTKKGATDRAISLSAREREILQLLWDEKTNKEIAEHICRSIRSVEKIRQDMKEKLGIRSTIGLLKFAINNRIVRVNVSAQTAQSSDVSDEITRQYAFS
jgi:DNA-binding NarL/FixJ family response regulator